VDKFHKVITLNQRYQKIYAAMVKVVLTLA
jgi:hypothetical protein